MANAPLPILLLVVTVHGCLPGPFAFNPAFSGGYYGGGGVPPMPLPMPMPGPNVPFGGGFGPRVGPMGPFRSEQQRPSANNLGSPSMSAQMDEIQSVSSLNCPGVTGEKPCKWGNAPDDDLDWTTVGGNPEADRWIATLGVHTYPEPSALALYSGQRNGWDSGRLVSDYLPCISNGLRITATAWRTKDTQMNEPRLQIVFNGYDFVSPSGGAIFLQDIVVEGTLSCNGESLDSHPSLIDENTASSGTKGAHAVGPLRGMETLAGLEAIDAAPRTPQFEDRQMQSAFDSNSLGAHSAATFNSPSRSIGEVPTIMESCLELSCNPSELSCKFWRSAGNNRWEIGSANRISNPLTGIHLPPGTAQKFLVAPFLDAHINSYTLVSESITVPLLPEVYFCFYEYYATHGLTLSVCTDKMDCFYKKNTLSMGDSLDENKRWNIRCAKLPIGTYELRVVAENTGDNKGEVGFLPIRLSKDPQGLEFIC